MTGATGTGVGPVIIGHAGMLTALVRDGLGPAMSARGPALRSVPGHSLAVAHDIASGGLPADLFGSADAAANRLLMGYAGGNRVRWYAVVATTALVLAYSPRSPHVGEFERARRGEVAWYEPLLRPGVRLGRDDPDTDPLGYYALFVAQLAERSGERGLAGRILGDDRNPDQVGWAGAADLDSGAIDAMFVYASRATAAGIPHVPLPDEVNLGDPIRADNYAGASFTNAAGVTLRGGVINASVAPVDGSPHADAARTVLDHLFSSDGQRLLRDAGLVPGPVLVGGDPGAVPAALRGYVRGTHTLL